MVDDSGWRPTVRDISAAEEVLTSASKFPTRLKIVRALKEKRDASFSQLASAAGTRPVAVAAFLSRWQTRGLESVLEFGRPRDLNKSQLDYLREQLTSRKLRSLDEVREKVKTTFGLKFDIRSIRAYCSRLGFDLPAKADRVVPKLHKSWNETNIAGAAGGDTQLKNRLAAIVRACLEPAIPLRRIADSFVPPVAESTLRADLKSLKPNTTPQRFVERRLRSSLIDRAHVRDAFYKWASAEYSMTGKAPTVRQAIKFLESEHSLKAKTKTVYKWLSQWRKKKAIPARKRTPREKFMPSEGLKVR